MSNSEKLLNLIISDELPDLFYPVVRCNLAEADHVLHSVLNDLELSVDDLIATDSYCSEIVSALNGYWSVLCEHGYGSYIYRHPDAHMKVLVGSMFFKKNTRGSRMAISKQTHHKLGELLSNTDMVLRLEALTKRLDSHFGLQTKVSRHTSDEGYTTLNIKVEFDNWNQTALFRSLFGPTHPYTLTRDPVGSK